MKENVADEINKENIFSNKVLASSAGRVLYLGKKADANMILVRELLTS